MKRPRSPQKETEALEEKLRQEAAFERLADECSRSQRVDATACLGRDARLGRQFSLVQDASQYGAKGVERLAKRLNMSVKQIYRLIARFKAFDELAIADLSAKAQQYSYVLCASVLDELATDKLEPPERLVMLMEAMQKQWRVRELRSALHGTAEPRKGRKTLAANIVARAELLAHLLSARVTERQAISDDERDGAVQALTELEAAVGQARVLLTTEGREDEGHDNDARVASQGIHPSTSEPVVDDDAAQSEVEGG